MLAPTYVVFRNCWAIRALSQPRSTRMSARQESERFTKKRIREHEPFLENLNPLPRSFDKATTTDTVQDTTTAPNRYPNSSSYISTLKPTISFFPIRSVGARKLPVGPKTNLRSSSSVGLSFFRSSFTTFLPFAANKCVVDFNNFAASAC